MALNDWPTTAVSTTSTDADSDSIKTARPDINQTIVNVNGLVNSFGDLSNIANGQILKYDSTQDKFLPADESGGGTGTPAGSDTEIQYNDSGSFGADQYFTLKAPGGGTSCTFNHRGHLNTGLSAGGQITSSESTFQISHDSSSRFKIIVESSGADGYYGGNPAIRWGGDGAYGIYPQNTSFDSDQSHVTIAQGGTDGELKVKFRSNGSATANIIMEDLPTADPNVAGQLWSNSGVLTVSSG